ncbi:MAG: FG-GAP-like repeat-containing protein [Carboxylicivirga sp.]|nr:FG-GAP-like repeat-containing protein [Carboxylicivirga sp.]
MRLIITTILMALTVCSFAQNRAEDIEKTSNFPKMRKMLATEIQGAPVLSQPKYLEGTKNEIRVEKHGLIYPAFYDWNKDGKKDLMLGEFETGDTGSFIKVYLNEGSDKKPKYSGEYFYATDVNGDTITNHQWCCIGIHPRLVDMDGDGHLDLLSGQYNPGLVSMWRGSEKGFQPREFIPQEGYVDKARLTHDDAPWNPKSNSYWNYTSADFADFNGDGLMDLFVGGTDGFRVALNVGTKEKPAFGLRQYLHHINGEILNIEKPSQDVIKELRSQDRYPNMSGVGKGYMTPIDWDNDGVLDLLVTHEYYKKGHNPIEFFRGVKTDKGIRFEQAKPLFAEANGEKAMPGCQPMITVVDYNNDGVKDIVMGISIPTINGFEFAPEPAWEWVKDTGIEMPGKDAGRALKWYGGIEGAIKKIESDEQGYMKKYMLGKFEDYKYLTMRHRGYVFVLLGSKNKTKAKAIKSIAKPAVENKLIPNEQSKMSSLDGPVNYAITLPERVSYRKELELVIDFKLRDGWYLYSENEANTSAGFIPTVINVEFDEVIVKKIGDMETPPEQPKGGMQVYKGDRVRFIQKFKVNFPSREASQQPGFEWPKKITGKVNIKFQTCNNDMCLPPEEVQERFEAKIVSR